jgi:hypothetical protein
MSTDVNEVRFTNGLLHLLERRILDEFPRISFGSIELNGIPFPNQFHVYLKDLVRILDADKDVFVNLDYQTFGMRKEDGSLELHRLSPIDADKIKYVLDATFSKKEFEVIKTYLEKFK